MVWKLYKMLAQVLFRYVVMVCFDRTNDNGLAMQLNKIHRLRRIIIAVRQYYGLHPNYSKDTYGTMENYLRQHVSEHDWILLTQLHFVESTQGTSLHNPVLDMA